MKHENVHEIIGKHFHTSRKRVETDNMPALVRKGNRNVLADVFAELEFSIGVEIGTRVGGYAKVLCESNPNLHLFCVDPWFAGGFLSQRKQDYFYREAVQNLKPYRVEIIREFSMDALNSFGDESLDFVYIDGAHDFDNVCVDIIFWSYKVKDGGMIAVHDYMPGHGAGVVKAVDGYTHCHDIRPWYITRERLPTAFWVNSFDDDMRNIKRIVTPLGKRLL